MSHNFINGGGLIDSHCHLHLCNEPIESIIERSKKAGLCFMLNATLGQKDFLSAYKSLHQFIEEGLIGLCLGSHPENEEDENINDSVELLNKFSGVIFAIGEIGLDFGKDGHFEKSFKEKQIIRFKQYIQLATEYRLPIVIHNRNADHELLQCLEGFKFGGIMHCFTSTNKDFLQQVLSLGFYISFSGIVTFGKSADSLREMIPLVPINRILIETDSPYLAPTPHRGKANAPYLLPHTFMAVANILGYAHDDFVDTIHLNFAKLFDFKFKNSI